MTEQVDLVVVGAGIQGAGVAQAAAAAGYRVMLLERTGIASGTSSRSSKLIHGGLRYLETGQWRLVRECLREREILLRLAPTLVRLVPHYLPVYRTTRRRPFALGAGLSLYALLGGLSATVRFRRLAAREWPRLAGLRQTDLQAVFRYYDAQTDDAALTAAVVASARSLGAGLELPAELLAAEVGHAGITVRYRGHQGDKVVNCTAMVNAAGPWVNQVIRSIEPAADIWPVDLIAGTHIVLPSRATDSVFYTEAPSDGRAVFIMPWKDATTLVGTTERQFQGDPAEIAPTAAEIDYLLDTVRHYFPDLSGMQPSAAFAGLRVLPAARGSVFGRSRETCLRQSHAGRVLSIYGGKLTAYRATAERVMQRLKQVLPCRNAIADTAQLPLA